MGDVKYFFRKREIWCPINIIEFLPKILESQQNKRYITYDEILIHYRSARLGGNLQAKHLAYREVL